MKVTSFVLKMSAAVAVTTIAPASAKIIMAGDSTMAQSSSTIQGLVTVAMGLSSINMRDIVLLI